MAQKQLQRYNSNMRILITWTPLSAPIAPSLNQGSIRQTADGPSVVHPSSHWLKLHWWWLSDYYRRCTGAKLKQNVASHHKTQCHEAAVQKPRSVTPSLRFQFWKRSAAFSVSVWVSVDSWTSFSYDKKQEVSAALFIPGRKQRRHARSDELLLKMVWMLQW